MSSLAASRADNFYFPPEWRPEYGGISKFQGSKGANQYQQHGIVRFELPFDGWCLGCNQHLGKGTRFNAKKENVGKYFTTTLYAFDMKCISCDQRFVIKTDPANRTYNFFSGIRKMEQDYELDNSAADSDNILVIGTSDEERFKLNSDPIYRLQQDNANSNRAGSINQRINNLIQYKDAVSKSDGATNSVLRRIHREKKRHHERQLLEGGKRGVSYPILDDVEIKLGPRLKGSVEGVTGAESLIETNNHSESRFKSRSRRDAFRTSEQVKFASIQAQSIFSCAPASVSIVSSCGSGERKSTAELPSTSGERKRKRLQQAMIKNARQNIDMQVFR